MKITRFLFFIVGIAVLTLGASLTLKASLGAGPWDALAAGQSKATGLTIGTCVIINGLVLLFINSWLMKTGPEYFAVVTFFLIGILLDFWLMHIWTNQYTYHLIQRIAMLIFGIMLLACGITMYIHSRFPVNPIDNLMVAIHKRFGMSLMTAKTMAEIFALVFAILLKGPVGIGTLIVACTIGPIIQLLYRPMERLIHKVGSILG
ncbi:membrane protein [Bacillus sp. 165]|uniref:YczE/YyaS/YitT family protein n=1 Tax=Bacillus sp. 165 TaxID=1529117 RepID=UPI001ADCC4BB|nr:membrane protein [Bacillus sp. 165]MBO9131445.1 membrane protein [Bacillus sp. 165]